MMNRKSKEDVLAHLRSLDYLWVKEPIRDWFSLGKIIGWNVNTSSLLRKPYSLERLTEYIEENQLPLTVEDSRSFVNSFKVFYHDQ